MSNKKKIIKRVVSFISVFLIIIVLGFLIYAADYYKAEEVAISIL